jgi:hypothetical protein
MIIDRSRLAGLDAYFRRSTGGASVNLGGPSPAASRTRALGDGMQLEVRGLRLTIVAGDLVALLARTDVATVTSEPLFRVTVVKEIFPGLLSDPYRHRVHTIAGFEDFTRGAATNCRPMEVDGIATLVSTGTDEAVWTSPLFRMPSPVTFDAAAWDLATTRLTPSDGFTYTIELAVWTDATATDGPPAATAALATNATPPAGRFVTDLGAQLVDANTGDALAVEAYRLTFRATVRHDAYLAERHHPVLAESLGRPLLRAVHLLEPIECVYDVYSIGELLRHASEYYLPEVADGVVTHLTAMLDLPATLVGTESHDELIEIDVRYDGFDTFEALLDADVLVRPPRF